MVSDLTKWVRVRKKRRVSNLMLRFLVDFPEGIRTPAGSTEPFRAGDLVSLEVVGKDVAHILIEREAVEVYHITEKFKYQ